MANINNKKKSSQMVPFFWPIVDVAPLPAHKDDPKCFVQVQQVGIQVHLQSPPLLPAVCFLRAAPFRCTDDAPTVQYTHNHNNLKSWAVKKLRAIIKCSHRVDL